MMSNVTSEDISATNGATAEAPPNLLMLRTCLQIKNKFQKFWSRFYDILRQTAFYFLQQPISTKKLNITLPTTIC